MKDILTFWAKLTGGTIALALAFWAIVGAMGVADGSDDDLSNSFRAALHFVTK